MATPEEVALHVLDLAQAGAFEDIHALFAPQLQPLLSPDVLRTAWEGEVAKQGAITALGTPVTEVSGPPGHGVTLVKIPVTFQGGSLAIIMGVTGAGALTGIQLGPAAAAAPVQPWEPPPYADVSVFREEELVVGDGPLAVPGTLSVPRGSGPIPAVVLLPGSGSLDRDETIGRNKPLKDLAWGLASLGVAVLRFDKVTYAHPAEVLAATSFTLVDEYMVDAQAAIAIVRGRPEVDPARVFLAGHSLGGTVAPRVVAAEPDLAGMLILAGSTEPLHWIIVRQARYLAALSGHQNESLLDELVRRARQVDDVSLSESTPPSELPMGVPAPYWLDLRDYDPVAVAAKLRKPMLILQGGRDYQVTVAEDLPGWRQGLEGRPEVDIRVYPDLNHMFFTGSGTPGPGEYEPAQHVAQQVVSDVVQWIEGVGAGSVGSVGSPGE